MPRQIQIWMNFRFSWSQVILVKTTVLCSCVWTTIPGSKRIPQYWIYLGLCSFCLPCILLCYESVSMGQACLSEFHLVWINIIQEYELGSSLLEKCKQTQPMIQGIIETTTDDECMLFEALSLNEELQQIISKFDLVEICSKDPKETDNTSSASLQEREASELGKW